MSLIGGFDEVYLPLGVMQQIKVEIFYPVRVVPLASGLEQRLRHRRQARRRYELSAEALTPELARALLSFHAGRGGALRGFRLRDPLDFMVTDQVLGTGDGQRTQFSVVGGTGEAQRRILKPRATGAVVKLDQVPLDPSAFLVDEIGGAIGFSTPPRIGQVVSTSLKFDVPVRFETQALGLESLAVGGFCLKGVTLVELLAEIDDALN